MIVDRERQRAILDALEMERCWPRPPECAAFQEWERQYESIKGRYKTLVLNGGSEMGKTHFCQYYFREPEEMLVLNCEGTIMPDLDEFEPDGHRGITLDECCPLLILKHKRVFQCLPYRTLVKQSPTQMYKSSVMLSGVRIIVTTNSWDENFALCTETEKAWLNQNVIVVQVTHPLWRDNELVHASQT